jgi:anti-sigma factor RsiW
MKLWETTMRDLTCERWSELLRGYADGALAPAERSAVEAHAASCATCQQILAEYLAVPGVVRRATDVAIPSDVRERLAKLFAWKKSERKGP